MGMHKLYFSGTPELVPTSDIMTRGPKARPSNKKAHLVAFPLESNFNGARYDPNLVNCILSNGLRVHGYTDQLNRRQKYDASDDTQNVFVLLDAAKACGTSPPDISRHPADFVAISFYKIFGYPTGLGALVAKKKSLAVLNPSYFGGGTINFISPTQDQVSRY